jgi:predicted nucleotidyltransferase
MPRRRGMRLRAILQSKRDEILRIAAKHGAYNVRIFGSVVRGEDNETSDVDFLVGMEPGRSLLDLAGLGEDLEGILQRSVDVITDRGVSPYLKERIYSEAVAL